MQDSVYSRKRNELDELTIKYWDVDAAVSFYYIFFLPFQWWSRAQLRQA